MDQAADPLEPIIRAAWLEWTVTRTVATCNGERFIPHVVEIPRNFRQYELGFSCGPNIVWTASHLAKINRRNMAILSGQKPQKPKRSEEQEEAERRRREWKAILRFRRAPLPACA